jgi:DNA-directed RNA polymerase subunit RPC12/RpoP
MPERHYEVQPYGVDYICDECGRGAMVAGQLILKGVLPQWEHTCVNCGRTAALPAQYPTIRWERISTHLS